MILALAYLQFHSIVNRLLMRFKRLKQPKYLAGAVVGALYFYWYFFRHFLGFGGPRAGGFSFVATPDTSALIESFGAIILFVIVLLAWIVPHQRAALTFTETEVAFLFPAPISRRGLIQFKLARSQLAILFTTFFLMLVTNRFGGNALIHAAGWWLILSTLNLHFLGSSFAVTMLMDRGIATWKRRIAAVLVALALLAGGAFWVKQTMPHIDLLRLETFEAAKDAFRQVMDSGPWFYVLLPFRLIVRPFLAPHPREFFVAAGPALLLLGLHYLWVVRANVAFEEASVEASKRLADRVASIRAGNWRGADRKIKGRNPPFALRPSGLPAVAIVWKNLLSANRGFTMRFWIILGLVTVPACIALARSSKGEPLILAAGSMAGMGLVWCMILGPQVVRRDFRQDLPMADLLKSYPLPGWQMALGQILAPVAVLTRIQWFLLIPAISAFFLAPGPIPVPERAAISIGVVFLAPLLNLITLQIPNAAVLLFPAWFQTGKEGPQGIEASGQRIIFMVGQFVVLMVSLLPAALAFALVFFLVRIVLPVPVAILLGAAATALALAIEAAVGMFLLGWLFERFDIAELNP